MAELGKDAIEMMRQCMTQGDILKSNKLVEVIIAKIERR